MRTTNFDAIAAAAALDRQASTVRDGSGDLYDEGLPGHRVPRWLAPPPMKKLLPDTPSSGFIGKRFGRLLVLGVWDGGNPKKKALWVVRCDCGYYEGWKVRTIRGLGQNGGCTHCQQTDRLRARAAQPSTSLTRKATAERLDAIAQRGRSE